MIKASQERAVGEVKEVEGQQKSLEKQLKQKDWELLDVKAMKDARYIKNNITQACVLSF